MRATISFLFYEHVNTKSTRYVQHITYDPAHLWPVPYSTHVTSRQILYRDEKLIKKILYGIYKKNLLWGRKRNPPIIFEALILLIQEMKYDLYLLLLIPNWRKQNVKRLYASLPRYDLTLQNFIFLSESMWAASPATGEAYWSLRLQHIISMAQEDIIVDRCMVVSWSTRHWKQTNPF